MKAYSYDPVTKVYEEEVECQPDPMDPGGFLCPGHATFIKPLDPVAGKWAVYNEADMTWSLQDIPVPPAPPEPTPEEKKAELLEWLEGRNDAARLNLSARYIAATVDNDNTAIADLKTKWATCKTKYNQHKNEINAGSTTVVDDFPL